MRTKARVSCTPSDVLKEICHKAWRNVTRFYILAACARCAFKEEFDWNTEHRGHLLQAAGTYAIGALLVFLHLLARDAECFAKLLLAHANDHAPHTYAATGVPINGMGICRHKVSLGQSEVNTTSTIDNGRLSSRCHN